MGLETGDPNDGEKEMSKEEYERLTQKYGQEYFRPMPVTNAADKRFAFYRQVLLHLNTLFVKMRSLQYFSH